MATLTVNSGVFNNKKNKRINFLAPEPLVCKIVLHAKENQLTESGLIRRALERYFEEYELKKLEKELEEGYEANAQYYAKTNSEWEVIEVE